MKNRKFRSIIVIVLVVVVAVIGYSVLSKKGETKVQVETTKVKKGEVITLVNLWGSYNIRPFLDNNFPFAFKYRTMVKP